VLAVEKTVEVLEGIPPDNIPDEVLNSAEPLLLRGLVSSWPCVRAARAGRAASLSYLRRFALDREVVVFRGSPEIEGRFFYNEDLTGFNFDRTSATVEAMLTRFESLAEGDGEPSLYIGSTSVEACFPGFRRENDIGLADLRPLVSIWMGNRTRIAAHFDFPDNIACVAAGRRRFTLFPPDQLANLYVGPLDFTPAGQAISLVDFHSPDYQRFPLFREAQRQALVAELEPGDAIYLPSMWWHHVEGLESFNVLVNYWWRSTSAVMGNPNDALIHALLCLRGLTAEQKRAWRGIFEYYIFNESPDALAHIPEGSRGVLGNFDETTARQLRAMLRGNLGK
jgi:hypothetical protein